jgi:hypothetical protein
MEAEEEAVVVVVVANLADVEEVKEVDRDMVVVVVAVAVASVVVAAVGEEVAIREAVAIRVARDLGTEAGAVVADKVPEVEVHMTTTAAVVGEVAMTPIAVVAAEAEARGQTTTHGRLKSLFRPYITFISMRKMY